MRRGRRVKYVYRAWCTGVEGDKRKRRGREEEEQGETNKVENEGIEEV